MKFILSFLLLISLAAHADNKTLSNDMNNFVSIHKARADYLISRRSNIVGIEVIIADRSSNIASRFGHALLRFVGKDGVWTNDFVVSFGALPETEKLSLIKGFFGGYKILPEIMTMHEYWQKYAISEKRDLRRFALNLTPDQLDQFLIVAFDYIKNPQKLNNYTFAKNNCVGVISKLLIESNLTVNNNQAIVPTMVQSWLKKNKLTFMPELIMKNPSLIEQKYSQIDIKTIGNEELVEKFNLSELSYIFYNKQELNFSQIEFLSEHLLANNFLDSDAFGFIDLSPKLYGRCFEENCLRTYNKLEKNLKAEDQLNIIAYRLEENNEAQNQLLKYREFKKWDLLKLELVTFKNSTYSLTVKDNKVMFKTTSLSSNEYGVSTINTALQFKINGNRIFFQNEEIGQLNEGRIQLKNNFRFVLHNKDDKRIFSLLKI